MLMATDELSHVDGVEMSEDTTVAEFRDYVIGLHSGDLENANIEIFKNQMDFTKNGKPLNLSERLNDLDNRAEDPIIIAVSPSQPPALSQIPPVEQITWIEPQLVQPPLAVNESDPPFIAQHNWLLDIMALITTNMAKLDCSRERVPPLAFIRCNYGGKTLELFWRFHLF